MASRLTEVDGQVTGLGDRLDKATTIKEVIAIRNELIPLSLELATQVLNLQVKYGTKAFKRMADGQRILL